MHNIISSTQFSHDATAVPSLHQPGSGSQTPPDNEGTWGERDVGGPVNRHDAMLDYEEMKLELTKLTLERTKSRRSSRSRGAFPIVSSLGFRNSNTLDRSQSNATATTDAQDKDVEAQDGHDPDELDFDVVEFLRDGHLEKRNDAGRSSKRVGVVYRNLTVKGVGASMMFAKTLPEAILGTFGPDLYHILCRYIPNLRFGRQPPVRTIIHDFTGWVEDGEMMFVLGRPGSGCSTFLKVIANQRGSYAAVEGDVSYGGIAAEEQKKRYNGEVNYNPEDDQHMPTLTVWQTLRFALMNKTKKHEAGSIPIIIDSLLKMFGIPHTKGTLVGNEYVRGVSGGERKRVSIAETLATKSSVVAWDNSSRGLDASTALDYAKSLRIMTDISNRTTFVSLYQAGQGIYDLMDKVLVIEEGRMIYQGPAKEAKQYFLDLGFHCPDRQTTADFLTSVGDPNERQFQPGKEASTPKTAEELEAAFRSSSLYKRTVADVESYEKRLQNSQAEDTREFKDAVEGQKSNSRLVTKNSNFTVSFPRQVWACTKRELWLLWGDKTGLYTKFFIIISNGLIVGSLFYGESFDTSGAFSRGGALFFCILFLGWLQLSELMRAVSGRVVVERHKDYAFYHKSAVVVARVVLDFPVLLIQSILFTVIQYWMSDLAAEASKFFIALLFVYTSTICITALYRMFAALSPEIDTAVRFSGLALNLLIIFVGYVIPKQSLLNDVPWFGWLIWVNPISYAYEAVLTNEFYARSMECAPNQLVPAGPGLDPRYQSCALPGSQPGSTAVTGEQYYSTAFTYSRSNLWRNLGVVIAFTVLYILITATATELFSFAGGGGGALIFKKTKKAEKQAKQELKVANLDEENAIPVRPPPPSGSTSSDTVQGTTSGNKDETTNGMVQSKSVFTWEKVEYDVPYEGGSRKLLNRVNGYVKPGVMIALIGASGAGKTTLLHTLSQRQRMGVVKGDMLVDGQPLGIDFQRGTGYCEQMDLHEQTATIREALEFSALLRQDRNIPRQEKIAYVDNIIDLLELQDIQDALIMSLGVEQRKRLTIGVELAAKPSLLLFLDEPTSGLDSQSAFNIVRFLKKLAHAGQAIICTIHQPSSILIEQFDMILALNPGGNQFYFGPVGENGKDVIKYFSDRGAECPPEKNVAEFILETAAKSKRTSKTRKRIDWNEEWNKSEQNQNLLAEIARLKEQRSKEAPKGSEKQRELEFAASTMTQTYLLTKRTFVAYWRDPSYLYGKLFVSVIIGIFNGFTFYMLENNIASLQSRMFSAFLILLIPPTIVNGVVPKFYMNRALWEARESPSKIYGWFAFCTAQVLPEIPWAVVGSVLYFFLWYYPAGLPYDSSTAGYTFFMTMLFFFFQASWGQWICAFAPSFTIISNVLPFFFVMVSLFNGIVRPYDQIPTFWRYWMYYCNPSTWWLGGVLSATLGDFPIECTEGEATIFNPPPNETCGSYANPLVANMGVGYITNPDATANCGYCPYANGNEYLATLNISPDDKWRDFGIFMAFVVSNWALVYFLIYTVRVRGWTFGFGPLFHMLGKGVNFVQGLFSSRKEKKEQEK